MSMYTDRAPEIGEQTATLMQSAWAKELLHTRQLVTQMQPDTDNVGSKNRVQEERYTAVAKHRKPEELMTAATPPATSNQENKHEAFLSTTLVNASARKIMDCN